MGYEVLSRQIKSTYERPWPLDCGGMPVGMLTLWSHAGVVDTRVLQHSACAHSIHA